MDFLNKNPFLVSGYAGQYWFCDREQETKLLLSNIENGVNTTLLSLRKMGKTGIIYHIFDKFTQHKEAICLYIDIFHSVNMQDFTNILATAILKKFPEKQSIGKKFVALLKSFKPTISFDGITGAPEVTLSFGQVAQYQSSIASLLNFLEQQKVPVILAIDEFQQVALYPEKNMEALLRGIIQNMKNVRFIFSGSNMHLLTEIFKNTKRPFFSSTQFVHLKPIERKKYEPFIIKHFNENKRIISADAMEFIMTWTKLHTYYTQMLCNKIYATGIKNITLNIAQKAALEILEEHETVFSQYRNLITPIQWNVMAAIAKEEKLYKPNSSEFLKKYNLGNPSNIQRALESLNTKEMLFKDRDEVGSYYSVYDC
ncbi:MAG: AAA family ATPase, partial [Bacteroidia bacterium]